MRIQVPLQYNPSLASSGEASHDNPEPTPLCLAHPTDTGTEAYAQGQLHGFLSDCIIPFLIFKEGGNEGFDVYF